MKENKSIVATRINELRGTESQQTMADKIRSNQGYVSKMISGLAEPSVATLIALSKAYGVSIDWILGLTDSPTNSIQPDDDLSYSMVFVVLANLYERGAFTAKAEEEQFETYGEINRFKLKDFHMIDPVLNELLAQITINKGTDISIFNQWVNKHAPNFENAVIPHWGSPLDVDYHNEFEDAKIKDCLETMEDYVNVMKHFNKAQ